MSGIRNGEGVDPAYERTHLSMFGYVKSWVHKIRIRQVPISGLLGLVGGGIVGVGREHLFDDGIDPGDLYELAAFGGLGLLVGVIGNLIVQSRIFKHRQSAYRAAIRATLGSIAYGQDPVRRKR